MSQAAKPNLITTPPTAENIAGRSGNELVAICVLLGIPKSGTRDRLRERILKAWELRTLLKDYGDDPAPLAAVYKGKELQAMCRTAGVYSGGNKYGRAAALLGWRNNCRRKGQEALSQARAEIKVRRELPGHQERMAL